MTEELHYPKVDPVIEIINKISDAEPYISETTLKIVFDMLLSRSNSPDIALIARGASNSIAGVHILLGLLHSHATVKALDSILQILLIRLKEDRRSHDLY